MPGKPFWLRMLAAGLILAAGTAAQSIFTGCAGCSDGDGGVDPEPGLQVTRTSVVPSGSRPVWTDAAEDAFLFVYREGAGDPGIYHSDTSGTVTPVYQGGHNHDYEPSPDGSQVAFSTSDLDGGVFVADLPSGGVTRVLAGAKHPSWAGDTTLVVQTRDSEIVLMGLSGTLLDTLSFSGIAPRVSPNGSHVAWYSTGSGSTLRLYIADRQGANLQARLTGTGLDAVWYPGSDRLAATVFSSDSFSDLVEVVIAETGETVLIVGATWPSISADGTQLFANRIENGRTVGVHYMDLATGRREFILDAAFPAAGNGQKALVQDEDGISLITFEPDADQAGGGA